MKTLQANRTFYEATLGRVVEGEDVVLDDDVAERWIRAGVASEPRAKPPPEEPGPQPPDPEPMPDDEEEDEDEALKTAARKLADEGATQRAISEQLGVSRHRIRALLNES